MPESKTTAKKKARKSIASKKRSQPRRATVKAIPAEEWRRMISEAAYFIAEQHGFSPGSELDDWLLAEAQINTENVRHGG